MHVKAMTAMEESVEYDKPVPVPDRVSDGFWTAAKAHVLAIQRCQYCSNFSHPPDVVCSKCQATEPSFTFEEVSGRGVIKTWTIVRDTFLPSFKAELPYIVVIVELEEQPGLRVLARLSDGADMPLALGARVQVGFDDVTVNVTLPHFKLVSAQRGRS